MLVFRLLFLLCCLSTATQAKLSLPALFQDHMVLQRESFPAIWGRAEPGERVRVTASWDSAVVTTYADSRGKWLAQLATPEAGGPYEILVMGEAGQLRLRDVLIGEVWLASGQSNMRWRLHKALEGDTAAVDFPQIRLFQVQEDLALSPRYDCKGQWQPASRESSREFSAVAFFFARELHQELGVPIGIIQSTVGGTPAQAWMSRPILESQPRFRGLLNAFDDALRAHRRDQTRPDPLHKRQPAVLYNAMIEPLIPFELRGVIWYQGEGNAYDPYQYSHLFPTLIYNWRRDWNRNFSFYWVQVAPFEYQRPLQGAGLREAQLQTFDKVPNSGLVSLLDLGTPADIHPRSKRPVEERLARWALAKDYGRADLTFSGPLFEQTSPVGDSLRVQFRFGAGLYLAPTSQNEWEIAGEDRRFRPAQVKVADSTVWVWSPEVPAPVAVRYAFRNAPQASLFNGAGLPAAAFRSDDWPLFFADPRIEARYDPVYQEFVVTMDYPGDIGHELRYALKGKAPGLEGPLYTKPLTLKGPDTLQLRPYIQGVAGPEVARRVLLQHAGMGAKLSLDPLPLPDYARGLRSLQDGLRGSDQPHDGYWQGFAGGTVRLQLEFDDKREGLSLALGLLALPDREPGSLPMEVLVEGSKNGRKFKTLGRWQPAAQEAGRLSLSLDLGGQPLKTLRLTLKGEATDVYFLDEWEVYVREEK